MDGRDPAIDGGIWLDVGVAEHTFDITGVDFYDEIADADEVKVRSAERMKESIEFDFCLGIA